MDDPITFLDVIGWLKQYIVWIIAFLSIFIEIVPVKFHPISWLGSVLFKSIRKDMDAMKTDLNSQIENVRLELKTDIDQVKEEQRKQKEAINDMMKSRDIDYIAQIRSEIISFNNSLINGLHHTKGEYMHIKDINKTYHALIEKYDLDNGILDEEMEAINRHYDEFKNSDSVYF